MASMKAQMETARVALERTQKLFAANLAAKGDLDTAQGNYDSLKAPVRRRRRPTSTASRRRSARRPRSSTSRRANLGYTKIYSPVDGVVVTRSIDPGATVVASFQAPVLFVIAQDLRKMRVLADVDEADVGKIAEGMDADCVVDAFPGEIFHGKVSQIRYSAEQRLGRRHVPGASSRSTTPRRSSAPG